MWQQKVLLLLLCVSAPAMAGHVCLVRDGQAVASVVVEEGANDLVRQAAEDVRHYVETLSGALLPMRFDGKSVPGPAVYIGKCKATTADFLPPADSNPETYAIHVRDGSLFLSGNHPPAAVYAAQSFIEDDLGIRWFAPGDLWEYVPDGTPGSLVLEVENRVVVPDWSPRVWSGHAWTPSWRAWERRNKALCIPPVPFRNMQNHLHRIFAPEKYVESHPEYYPLIKGERWIPPGDYHNWRPCTSNPEVLRLTAEAARAYLDAHPEHNSFSLAMDDIYRLCGCGNCRAMDAHPEDYEKKRFSSRHYTFVNAVAKELAKTHPDKYIGTLCYHIARELPDTVPQLEANVFISMTQRVGEWWRPGRRESDMRLTEAWRERCSHMSRYGYMGLGFVTPRVFPHAMAEGMKFDHALGFEGVYNECYVILPNAAPMMWMLAKLQWDTSLDADALLDEFYTRMFGPAAETMKQYYGLLESSYMAARPERLELASWGHRSLRTHALALAPADVARAEALLQEAARLSNVPKINARIDTVAAALEFASYVIRASAWARELSEVSIETLEQAHAALDKAKEFARLGSARERFWAEAMERDDIFGESLRGLRGKGYLVTDQIDSVEAPAASALQAALDILDETSPAEAIAAVEGLAAEGGGVLAEMAKTWLVVSRSDLPNLLENPGFEERHASMAPPKAWSSWHNGAREGVRFFPAAEEGRKASTAAGIGGADSACYLQRIPVKPGQRYVCAVHAKALPKDMQSTAGLGVRWQTAEGKWHENRGLEPEANVAISGRRWRRLSLIACVPEGAEKLVFLLKATGQEKGTEVLFDEAVLSLLPPRTANEP